MVSGRTVVSNPDDSDVLVALVRPCLDAYCDTFGADGAGGTKDKDGR